ncbi:hypothetical protein [Pseudomonas zeae]|uniref:Uncharacterized protein n=1 Tax=Pseudomonas zeae TaxID=2745510 RepID=A0A9E6NUK5_9PSED|nr:hypothetical protein [Pseudomonas zeae]QXI14162.1 hypothetical protein HU754_012320 [Pseudomonas zeae]
MSTGIEPITIKLPTFITALVVLIGAAGAVLKYFDFKLVPANSVEYKTDINEKYLLRKDVETNYITRSTISSDYLKKDEIERNYVPRSQIDGKYVTLEKYNDLQKKYIEINKTINEIPSPFKPITQELTREIPWQDEQLGIRISIDYFSEFESNYTVRLKLKLPDSESSIATMKSADKSLPVWKFRKHNRTFQLAITKLHPTTLTITEIN